MSEASNTREGQGGPPSAPQFSKETTSAGSREGDRRDKDRDRERRRSRDRDRDKHSSRHRSRSRERDKEKDKDRSSRRRKHSRSRSRSRSESPTEKDKKRKRKTGWDIAPTGFEIGLVPSAPASALNPHQSRQARRLYVGNIPQGVTEIELAEFFNTAMFTAGATKDNNAASVIAVQMNHEKNFAFIEFSCHEDATAGMGFDGITLGGHALKIRRPKDYKPVPTEAEQAAEASNNSSSGSSIPNIVSTNVEEGPNKIFIGGLPSYLTEEQVKELVSAFGQLKSFNLVKDTVTGNSKGFAFFEYSDPDVTDRACQTLNGMKLGDKTVLAQRANIGAKHNIPNPSTESILNNPTALNFLNLGMPIAAAAALLGININDSGSPTRILQLINIVSPNDLRNNDDYADVVDDIKQECMKYGTVLSVAIPRPPPLPKDEEPKPEVTWGLGRAFVEYKRPEETQKAMEALGGRKFSGHTIITGYFPEDKYSRKDYGPDFEEEMLCAERFRQMQLEKERQRLQQEDEY